MRVLSVSSAGLGGAETAAQAAAPAEGGGGTEQGQRARHACGWWPNKHFDFVAGFGEAPSANQASGGDVQVSKGSGIEGGSGKNGASADISGID